MFIKDTYSLLLEAANSDLNNSTSIAYTESQIDEVYDSFEEAVNDFYIPAEAVPVFQVNKKFVTEMQMLAPFMQSNGITSVAEALDTVAEANNLQPKEVGLLIESKKNISDMIKKAGKKGRDAKNKAVKKIKKASELPAKLKDKGYAVIKKRSKKEGCGQEEGCGNRRC